MSVCEKSSGGNLKAGQVWKVGDAGYIHIVTVGKRLVHYRMLRSLEQKAAAGKLAGHDEIATYLEKNQARQVPRLSKRTRKPAVKKP